MSEQMTVRSHSGAGAPAASMNCPVCGAADAAFDRDVPDHEYAVPFVARYAACATCRSVFQVPMPGLGELAAFYPANYHSRGGSGLLLRVRHDMRLKRLRPLLDGEGAVLDYGCGDGAFLVRAAEVMRGRTFVGYDISNRSEVVYLAGGAVTLIHGDLDTLLAHLPLCRLITMNHVIEHLPDPLAVVSALRQKLVPGGSFEGQTPAADSLEHRIFGARWSGYHAPRHTVVFSQRGLRQLLRRAGFGRITVNRAFNPASLAVSLASLSHRNNASSIPRHGLRWLACLGLATALAPIDLLSSAPAIVDFLAVNESL